MIDNNFEPQHHIQRYILDILRKQRVARFRDLRPNGVDSNAFSYHLSRLVKEQFVENTGDGYTLTFRGMAYIDRAASHNTRPRIQPKIMTMIAVIYNDKVLVRRKTTQPMIGQITLPTGMVHMEDRTIKEAARRELFEKVGLKCDEQFYHAGDCYMAIRSGDTVIMNALLHVFIVRLHSQVIPETSDGFWLTVSDVPSDIAPATRYVLKFVENWKPGDVRFFEEYSEEVM